MFLPIDHSALLQAASANGGGNPLMTFALFGGMIALFYFLIIAPQRKAKKQMEDRLSKLKSGDEVLLTSGLYATIDRVDGPLIYLKLGGNMVKARRNAVVSLASEGEAPQRQGIFG
jgi:preprotein translocase subunit YajC